MRYTTPVVAALFLAFLAGGCGSKANRVPDVEGERLDFFVQRLGERDAPA